MLCFYLNCDCGYKSEEACWGKKPWSDDTTIMLPIYNPCTGTLSKLEIPVSEWNASSGQTFVWEKNHEAFIRDQFGEKATVLIPAEYEIPIISCPRCGRETCCAVCSGIV